MMFKYDMGASIAAILTRSELRNALMDEWPNLVATNINTIANEVELVSAVAMCTGRTPSEATAVVRNWMERQNLAPLDSRAALPGNRSNENWENEGGSSPRPGQ